MKIFVRNLSSLKRSTIKQINEQNEKSQKIKMNLWKMKEKSGRKVSFLPRKRFQTRRNDKTVSSRSSRCEFINVFFEKLV